MPEPLFELYVDDFSYAVSVRSVEIAPGGVLKVNMSDGTHLFVKDWETAHTEIWEGNV